MCVAQQPGQDAHEDLGRRHRAILGALVELVEQLGRGRLDGFCACLATGNEASELLAPGAQVTHFRRIVRGSVERRLAQLFIGDGDAEARPELPQLFVVELLLLVCWWVMFLPSPASPRP